MTESGFCGVNEAWDIPLKETIGVGLFGVIP